MKKQTMLNRALALSLSAALLLTGCGDRGTPAASETPAAESQGAEGYDYRKYNAYLALSNEMYDMEDVLEAYFANVDYAGDFVLLEGGDYAAIKDAAGSYTPKTFVARQALEYVEDEPAYPKVDGLVKALGDSVEAVMDALNHLGSYMRFDEFEEDHLAKAAQIHAELWEALEIYDIYCLDFMGAMDELSDKLDEQYLEQLWEQGDLVLYYSECMMGSAGDVLGEISAQLYAAMDNGEETLPELELTELQDYFNQFNEHYNALKAALENTEEREKVASFTGTRGEATVKLYTSRVDSLYYYMAQLWADVTGNVDYLDAYDDVVEANSALIGAYNSII